MTGVPTPEGIARAARARYSAQTGQEWRQVPEKTRRAWMARCLPQIRAEHGIAADAVWQAGAWQSPDQIDLFDALADTTDTTTRTEGQ